MVDDNVKAPERQTSAAAIGSQQKPPTLDYRVTGGPRSPVPEIGPRAHHAITDAVVVFVGVCLGVCVLVAARSASGQERSVTADVPRDQSLGVTDRGVFSDLDDKVRIALPAHASAANTSAVIDRSHRVLIVYVDGWPTKPYPLGGSVALTLGTPPDAIAIRLRPDDARELRPLLRANNTSVLAKGRKPAPGDADDDGIPDPLDVLIGGHKTVINGASYGAGYIKLKYPMGDVPRDKGVCTDVVIRATRNAGQDLQKRLHRDIKRAARSYPMVSGKGNKNIDHRRVKTLLPYFKRHWNKRSTALDDANDPYRPGDIVFMDTFPKRSGPDHIGIVSNRLGDSGLPLVINNWTDGSVTSEMDLLSWVPITHRFRFPSRR